MTNRYLADTATVLTGESSLRNYAYEPSQQGSADEDSFHTDDGESVLSSMRSSVMRGLEHQKSQGFTSTPSVSTRQSEGLLWQDTETEVELYDTDEEDQDQPVNALNSYKEGKNRRSDSKSFSSRDELDSADSLAEQSKSQTSFARARAASDSMVSKESTVPKISKESKVSKKSKESNMSKKSAKLAESKRSGESGATKGNNQKDPSRSSKLSEPMKRLRFSKETLDVVVQSRQHTSRRSKKQNLPKLENVDYVSAMDDASTDQDLSTVHVLGKEECGEVFKDRPSPFQRFNEI